MSRIGKQPVTIPAGVKVAVTGNVVFVEGPKGKLSKPFPKEIGVTIDNNIVTVADLTEKKEAGALHGTIRAIIRNMVEGVATGYSKTLLIEGVGFKAILKGNKLDLALGYSHPINYEIPAGVSVVVTDGTKLLISGPDRHMVGQVASTIKLYKPVEPYKGKGVRVEGEYVRRKEGKKTA
ncbi:MAG: 50S ribosomal protein L6 [Verrucomicrobia bacterium]|jgi:large subunit ribosomal protein L6|nr:50S ribosomal protein L6 [Verrucomicrobiota bacterium]NBS03733.1 50S ribosomal protein L6 [Verrucomicrobiota bacterium]NBY37172.1 50S ribosomal protein L6 [Verrucomicrobiota bacterium]